MLHVRCFVVMSVVDTSMLDELLCILFFFFFQAEDGIRDVERSRGLGDVYKRQGWTTGVSNPV